jgi:cardiolipin synthase
MKTFFKWVIGIIGLIITITLFLVFVREIEMFIVRKHNVISAEPKRYPVQYSNLELFTNGKELNKRLFNDISNAKNDVHVYFFSVSNDQVSHKFLNLLKKKSDEGVKVFFAVDWLGGTLLSHKQENLLKEHGVHFTYFNYPSLPYLFASIDHRNHRRMAVIDGKIGYVGGFNIGKKYISLKKRLGHWEDLHLRLEGEGVQSIEKQFGYDWNANRSGFEPAKSLSNVKGQSPHQFAAYTKTGLNTDYKQLFDRAKKRITIYSPYFIPSDKVIWNSLVDASKRGVTVKFLYSKKSDAPLVEEAAYPYIEKAIKNGMKVYGYTKGIFHGKAILIDESVLMIGTTNFDSRSFHITDEFNCYIYDTNFIKKVEPTLLNEFNQTTEITKSFLDKLDWKDKIKQFFGDLIEYYL